MIVWLILSCSPWQGCHPSSRSSYCQEVTYPLPFSACLLHPLLALLFFFCDALLYLPDRAALPSQLPCLALRVWLLCYLTSLLFFFPKLSPFSHPLAIFSPVSLTLLESSSHSKHISYTVISSHAYWCNLRCHINHIDMALHENHANINSSHRKTEQGRLRMPIHTGTRLKTLNSSCNHYLLHFLATSCPANMLVLLKLYWHKQPPLTVGEASETIDSFVDLWQKLTQTTACCPGPKTRTGLSVLIKKKKSVWSSLSIIEWFEHSLEKQK